MKIHVIGGPGSGKTFLAERLSLETGKKESLRSLTKLLKWADRYQKVNLPEIRKRLAAYSEKVTEYDKPELK